MPILIKSSMGNRSCTVMKPQPQSKLAEDIVEALKGMTIKLEVKIADVVLAERPAGDSSIGREKSLVVEKTSTRERSSAVEEKREKSSELAKTQVHEKQLDAEKNPSVEVKSGDERSLGFGVSLNREASSGRVKSPLFEPSPVCDPSPVCPASPVIFKTPVSDPSPGCSKSLDEKSPSGERSLGFERGIGVDRGFEPTPTSRRLGKPLARTEPEKIILPPQVIIKRPKLRVGTLKVGADIKTMCISVVTDAKEPTAYIPHDDRELTDLTALICKSSSEIEALPMHTSPKVDDVVLAKSSEDNQWYRASIKSVDGDNLDIYFFDWGLHEMTRTNRVRLLNDPKLDLSKCPACAVKVIFAASTPRDQLDEIFKCESFFNIKVEYYDEVAEAYGVVVTKSPKPNQ